MSTTFTTLEAVAVFPSKSVAEYDTVYDPTALVSTSLELVTGVSPWNSSNAVAPWSTYVSPNSTVTGLLPIIVITGGTLSSYPPSSVIAATAPTPAIAISAF